MEQEIQKRIQICSQIGGQRAQNGVGFIEQEIQKGIPTCSQEDREDRMVLVLWNKRYRKGYAARRTERTEWCWFHGTIVIEKDTDMQQDRRTERTEWCWFYGTRDTEKDTDMQRDRSTRERGQIGQNDVGFIEHEVGLVDTDMQPDSIS
jgi:hypothetical protein